MRARLGAVIVAGAIAAGCSGGSPKTGLVAQVDFAGNTMPDAVDVHVFDTFGLIGQQHVEPARLPGTLTISGLPTDGGVEIRVVAVADTPGGHLLGGVRVTTQATQLVTASVILSTAYSDGDHDDVPDALDGCPFAADPLQTNTLGSGPNDACLGQPLPDFAGPVLDMTALPGDDLAVGADMAQPPPPPDLAPVVSSCPSGTQTGVGFCDGFEGTNGAAPSTANWAFVVGVQGQATIDTSRFYRGKSSLHLHSNGALTDLEVVETKYIPAHFYMRAFVWVPSGFDDRAAPIFLAEQNVNPYDGITLDLINGSFQTTNTVGTDKTLTSSTPMPKDQWVCLVWEVQTGPLGFTNLTVDATLANGLGGSQNLAPTPAIGQLALTLIGSTGSPARDLWVDEVIINSTSVDCLK
jgi:hypothetical protein